MQGFADDFVGDVRAVEVAGINVVHAAGNSLAQHRERRVLIPGRAEYARACELHGAIAKALHAAVAEAEAAGLFDGVHDGSPVEMAAS